MFPVKITCNHGVRIEANKEDLALSPSGDQVRHLTGPKCSCCEEYCCFLVPASNLGPEITDNIRHLEYEGT